MATFAHGSKTIVTLDSVNVSSMLNTAGVDRSVDDGDVTTFADTAKRTIPGLRDEGEISLEGPFSQELWIQLRALLGVAGKTLEIKAGNGASGMPKMTATGYINKLGGSFQIGDPAGITATFKIDGAITDATI